MLIQCKLADFPMSEGKSYMVPQERLYEEQELYLIIKKPAIGDRFKERKEYEKS